MKDVLVYLKERFSLSFAREMPIHLPLGRKDFARLLAEVEVQVGAEVGVQQGRYSQCLCKYNPKLELYSIDPWEHYEGYRDHVPQEMVDRFYAETYARLSQYKAVIMKAYSVPASEQFSDGYFDFVYIDANHDAAHITEDIQAWTPKVRPGGILAGHDYVTRTGKGRCDVKEVVDRWTFSHGIWPWFILDADRSPSWMWVIES